MRRKRLTIEQWECITLATLRAACYVVALIGHDLLARLGTASRCRYVPGLSWWLYSCCACGADASPRVRMLQSR